MSSEKDSVSSITELSDELKELHIKTDTKSQETQLSDELKRLDVTSDGYTSDEENSNYSDHLADLEKEEKLSNTVANIRTRQPERHTFPHARVTPYQRSENQHPQEYQRTSLSPDSFVLIPDSPNSLSSSPQSVYSHDGGSPQQVVPGQEIYQIYSPEQLYQQSIPVGKPEDDFRTDSAGDDDDDYYFHKLRRELNHAEYMTTYHKVMQVEPEKKKEFFNIDGDGDTCLMIAISSRAPNEMICALLETVYMNEKSFINHANKLNQTALYAAVFYDKHLIVGYLMERGANPNLECNAKCDTPLHIAVKKQYAKCVEALLKAKSQHSIDVTKENINGEDPLDIAINANNIDENIVRLLVLHGARPNRQMLHYVITCKWLHILKVFLESSGSDAVSLASAQFSSKDSSTLLHKVVQLQSLSKTEKASFIKLLLNYNADKDAVDLLGYKAADWLDDDEKELALLLR